MTATKTTYAKGTLLPSQLRKGSSAHRIYHAAAAGGWDLDLHAKLYDGNGDVQEHVLIVTWPNAPEGRIAEATFEFDKTSGAIYGVRRMLVPDEHQRRISRGETALRRHPGDSRGPKVADLVKAMGFGPMWKKAQDAEAAEKAALAAARQKVRDEERKIVGSQPVMRDLMLTIKNERNYSVKELRSNLEAIIERAQAALTRLDEGGLPDGNFPVVGQAGYQVDKHAGEAWALNLQIDRMEAMFGPVTADDGYIMHGGWQSYAERARKEKTEGDG